MDKLLLTLYNTVSNLRALSLRNAWHGRLVEAEGYAKLPLFVDRLVELEISGDPLAFSSLVELVGISTSLPKVQFHKTPQGFSLDGNQSKELAMCLVSLDHGDVDQNAVCHKKRKGFPSVLEEFYIDCPFAFPLSFEIQLVEALKTNKTLKVLRLPKLVMASFRGRGPNLPMDSSAA